MVIDFTSFCTLISLVVSEEKVCSGRTEEVLDKNESSGRAFKFRQRDELPTGHRKNRFNFERI